MTRIETTAIVDDNGTMSVSVPSNVAPGEHRVVLVFGDDGDAESTADDYLEQRETLLVFTGELPADPGDFLRELREDRLRHLTGDETR